MGIPDPFRHGFPAVTLSEIGMLVSLALNIGIAVVGATWGIAKIKDAVRDAMDAHKKEYSDQLERLTRSFQDTFTALRQHINDVDGKLWKKISEVELEAAKTYMRRESFYVVKAEIAAEIKDFRNDLKERLDRLETKVDTKT